MGDAGPRHWQLSTSSSGLSWQRIQPIADSLQGDEGAEPSMGVYLGFLSREDALRHVRCDNFTIPILFQGLLA